MEKHIKFPYKIEEADEFSEKWKQLQPVKVITDSVIFRVPKYYANIAEIVYNFKVRPDDVWIVTYPKSGTTLMQEMTWLILNDDYETAEKVPLIKRSPYLETYSLPYIEHMEKAKQRITNEEDRKFFQEVILEHWETLERNPKRRLIKTHLPFTLLPPNLLETGCKILYLCRNPKDAAVSIFKFRCPNAPDEDFVDIWDLFQKGSLTYGPFWEHVKLGWNNRGHKNFCFMFYEDVVKDMRNAIKKLSTFLEKDMTEKQIDKLENHLNIENFRKNKSVTKLYADYYYGKSVTRIVREGKVGGGRGYFTNELNERANKWIEENYAKTDLRFPVKLK